MSDVEPIARLSEEEVRALRFAAQRQFARWAKNPTLSPDQHARRNALKRAVAALHNPAFAHGCDLRPPDTNSQR